MSLLEDVFLEDEAGEAQELERIIEGDEYDERPRPSTPDSNENSEKEDEAEEDKRHVDPTSAKQKRVVKNPRVILNPTRLTGPRGIQVIPEHFKDFKFKGKGHEKEDLDLVLKKLEHWAYRLFPKFEFKDCLKKIETLGNKRPVMVHLTKIRTDQFLSEETVVQRDSSDDEAAPQPVPEEDEFDKLLQQQIELARATPTSARKPGPAYSTPMVDKALIMPKITSSPSINDEQRERMLRNRQLAEERRLAKLKAIAEANAESLEKSNISNQSNTSKDLKTNNVSHLKHLNTAQENTKNVLDQIVEEIDEESFTAVKNRTNVIDSDSDEDEALVINESVAVDVHDSHRNDENLELPDTDNQNIEMTENIEVVETEKEMENEAISRCKEKDDVDEVLDNTLLEANPGKEIVEEINADDINSPPLESNGTQECSEAFLNDTTEIGKNANKKEDTQNKGHTVEDVGKKSISDNNELQEDVMDVDFNDDF